MSCCQSPETTACLELVHFAGSRGIHYRFVRSSFAVARKRHRGGSIQPPSPVRRWCSSLTCWQSRSCPLGTRQGLEGLQAPRQLIHPLCTTPACGSCGCDVVGPPILRQLLDLTLNDPDRLSRKRLGAGVSQCWIFARG